MFKAHYNLERKSIAFAVTVFLVASIGGLVEIAPLFTIEDTVEDAPDMRVYTPLELAGRNIYIREGCYACHSQMIRTLQDDVDRYGHYSLAVESKYDHPMLWGSKRTGPDLARLGEKYSDDWQKAHLENPRALVPRSVMPAYPFLSETPLRIDNLSRELKTMQRLGVPYTDEMVENAADDAVAQADPDNDGAGAVYQRYGDATHVRAFDKNNARLTEMDALIAYLQILGKLTDITVNPETAQNDDASESRS